jgi:hypothetical protein
MLNRITERLFCQTRVIRCFSRINFLWNKHNNLYYWYEVRYKYSNNGHNIFDWVTQIGVRERKTLMNSREIKKIPKPLHNDKKVKRLLCNGQMSVEIMCYLGRFSK